MSYSSISSTTLFSSIISVGLSSASFPYAEPCPVLFFTQNTITQAIMIRKIPPIRNTNHPKYSLISKSVIMIVPLFCVLLPWSFGSIGSELSAHISPIYSWWIKNRIYRQWLRQWIRLRYVQAKLIEYNVDITLFERNGYDVFARSKYVLRDHWTVDWKLINYKYLEILNFWIF